MNTADSGSAFANFDTARVPSPCFVIDLVKLEDNLRILAGIAADAGVEVLLALKAFSCFAVADLVGSYLHGTAASGLWEARLARTKFQGAVHTFAPGLKADHLSELERLSDHLIFNTVNQWNTYRDIVSKDSDCAYGLRINPRHSEAETPLYDPCAPWSRLGAPAAALLDTNLKGLSGFHLHALCDQGFDPFDRLLAATEKAFGAQFGDLGWINLGGGQLFTADDYPVAKLVDRLRGFREGSGLRTFLEPGTAIALNAGVLVTEVLDMDWNDGHFAVIDCSATCHMPDVIEAPYTPDVFGLETVSAFGSAAVADPTVIRLGGPTCLAGDVIGTYRFPHPPSVGSRLMIMDQAYYTMVKASTFNGTPLPSIALWDRANDTVRLVKEFTYSDFEERLS